MASDTGPIGKRPSGVAAGLSLADVVQCTVEHVETSGLHTLTMRRIASALNVTPMALYHHVKSKDELLSHVAQYYLDELTLPAAELDWRRYLEEVFTDIYRLFVRRPVLPHVYLQQPVSGPAGYRITEDILNRLCEQGFSLRQAGELFASLFTYTLGATLIELGRKPYTSADSPHRIAAYHAELEPEYPLLAKAMGDFAHWLSSDTFRLGLRAFIGGWAVQQAESEPG